MKKIIILSCMLVSFPALFGQQPVDYILKARALKEAGKPEQAISLLDGAISGSNDARLLLERADANILTGDYSGAIRDFNEANRILPAAGEFGLARIYALKGDQSTALYHLELNLNSSFKKPEKEIMLDPAFSTIENRQEWRNFWKKERYSMLEKGLSEIEYYNSLGKVEETRSIISELKKSYDNTPEIQYAEGLTAIASGNYTLALKTMSMLNKSAPGNEKYLRALVRAQTASSNPAGASATYSELLSMGVADAELYILRADCYRKTGEDDKAMDDIKKYLELYPADRRALSLAGKVEANSGDNLQALRYFSENLKLHPNDPECYIDRANSYFVAKSWDMAISDYSMSLDLKPSNSDVWLNKGISLLNKGKVGDACHDFRKAFSLGNKRVTEYLSKHCIK
jgi:tetratricopeptide (TPR) repeat protein